MYYVQPMLQKIASLRDFNDLVFLKAFSTQHMPYVLSSFIDKVLIRLQEFLKLVDFVCMLERCNMFL